MNNMILNKENGFDAELFAKIRDNFYKKVCIKCRNRIIKLTGGRCVNHTQWKGNNFFCRQYEEIKENNG